MRVFGRGPAAKAAVVCLAAGLAVAAVSGASAELGQPKGITDEARDMHRLYLVVTAMAFAVFFLVEGAFVYALIRYRRRRSEEQPPQTHGNTYIEVLWTAIPIVIVLALFITSLVVLVRVEDDAAPEALTVDVQGFQFSWEFKYSLNDLGKGGSPGAEGEISVLGTGLKVPTLVIPVGEPVEFRLKSNDVIHSFYVRDFLYKLDLIPGRDNSFKVTARQTGEFTGQCAELCGRDHALMRFNLRVVTREEFDQWVVEQTQAAKTAREP